uniref:Zinc finger MYND domain-containing protein 12 n=1 Tax=Ciona intestinalis TaxID=7719 RepID=F6WHP2_CIOIN|nr:zinc finger MYND domain-containing protein 12 [Ciona intestinalis]|eukprot:XP_002127183.1 zinc finger MYND domain-containing protein 12 [Ciona intestinalis]
MSSWQHVKENESTQAQEELERSRQKIQTALKAAKERSNKNSNSNDDIDTKFNQLQNLGIKLLDILRDSGTDQHPDWINLTERMCQLLSPLEGSMPFMSSSEEREIRKKDLLTKQTKMMELTRIIGRKLLFEGKHNQAVPAAVQSLRFSIDVHGLNSVNLVPSYLILAEASIGLGKLSQGDEYLAQAEWTVLKSPDATAAVKSKLYRNIGLLYAAKGDYDNALRMLSEDIYHASKEWGTTDIHACGGYFHMANVFFRQNKMDVADSLYSQVTDNWFDFLKESVQRKIASPAATGLLGPTEKVELDDVVMLDEAQEAEAMQMLNAVLDIREQSPKQNNLSIAKVCHTLSMLYFLLNDIQKAQELSSKAQDASSRLPTNVETVSVPTFLKLSHEKSTVRT